MTKLETTDDLLRALRENREFREVFRREILTVFPDEKLDALTANVGTLARNMAALTEEVTAFAESAGSRFDRVDASLERVESRFDRVDDDLGVLKGFGLESRLYKRGVALMAIHLRMREGKVVRVAEADDSAHEFNSAILSGLEDGGVTMVGYSRILDADMIVAGTEVGSGSPMVAVIEAAYSLSVADLNKVCATAALVRRLLPEWVVKPVLYFVTSDEALAGDAADNGVTLIRATAMR